MRIILFILKERSISELYYSGTFFLNDNIFKYFISELFFIIRHFSFLMKFVWCLLL